jgi:hypothetical protein
VSPNYQSDISVTPPKILINYVPSQTPSPDQIEFQYNNNYGEIDNRYSRPSSQAKETISSPPPVIKLIEAKQMSNDFPVNISLDRYSEMHVEDPDDMVTMKSSQIDKNHSKNLSKFAQKTVQ